MWPAATPKSPLPAQGVERHRPPTPLRNAPSSYSGRQEHALDSAIEPGSYPIIGIGPMSIHALDVPRLTRRLVLAADKPAKTHHVITANAQFYNLAEQRRDFRACIARAEYVCADGISIVMACKWLGKTPVSRVPGVELLEQLCQQAVQHHLPVYFLGGKEGAAVEAAALLAQKYPGFQVAGVACPPHGFERNEALLAGVLADIRRVNPAILFVAMGAPRQEFFIHEHIRPLHIPVAIGVGGSFEMIGGRVRRAPRWVQKAGLEWAYRWAQEPQRLAKRYMLGNMQFSYYMLRYLLKGHGHLEAGHEFS